MILVKRIPANVLLYACAIATGCELGVETRDNENHCANHEGDAWCTERHGPGLHCLIGMPPECERSAPDGCELQRPPDACYSPCGGLRPLSEDPATRCEGFDTTGTTTTVTVTEETSSTTSSTNSGTATLDDGSASGSGTDSGAAGSSEESSGTGGDCIDHGDCPLATPACNASGVCVACNVVEGAEGDAACVAVDSSTPLCRGGECVACDENDASACPEEAPVCSGFVCVACSPSNTDACPAERPTCDPTNTCVACTAENLGACAQTPQTPLCFEQTCVACTAVDVGACGGTTPICDVDAHACVACTQDAECPSSVCIEATGECVATEHILHVDGDATCPGDGSSTSPYCSFSAALATVSGDLPRLVVVHERDGAASYQENIVIEDGRHVVLVAADGQSPVLQGTPGSPTLTVSTGAAVRIERVHVVVNTAGLGILVTGEDTFLSLDRCRVSQNSGGGLTVSDGASATIDRCHVTQNDGPGVTLSDGAEASIVNSFVGGPNDDVAVSTSASAASLLYSTIGGNLGTSRALSCAENSTVTVRNSLLLTRGEQEAVDCTGAVITYSGISGTFAGMGNLEDIEVSTDWIPGYNGGDFHLAEGHPFDGVARWSTGDPGVDIDGEPRNATDAAMGVAGADVIP